MEHLASYGLHQVESIKAFVSRIVMIVARHLTSLRPIFQERCHLYGVLVAKLERGNPETALHHSVCWLDAISALSRVILKSLPPLWLLKILRQIVM
jgi:hypothetical protein